MNMFVCVWGDFLLCKGLHVSAFWVSTKSESTVCVLSTLKPASCCHPVGFTWIYCTLCVRCGAVPSTGQSEKWYCCACEKTNLCSAQNTLVNIQTETVSTCAGLIFLMVTIKCRLYTPIWFLKHASFCRALFSSLLKKSPTLKHTIQGCKRIKRGKSRRGWRLFIGAVCNEISVDSYHCLGNRDKLCMQTERIGLGVWICLTGSKSVFPSTLANILLSVCVRAEEQTEVIWLSPVHTVLHVAWKGHHAGSNRTTALPALIAFNCFKCVRISELCMLNSALHFVFFLVWLTDYKAFHVVVSLKGLNQW